MVRIVETETALPPHQWDRLAVKAHLEDIYGRLGADPVEIAKMHGLVDNTAIDQRHLAFPVEHLLTHRPLSQVSREYADVAVSLAERAAQGVLMRAGWSAESIDHLIVVSCTGFMIPSIDAHLINRLGLRPTVRRLPIMSLGCAAGAVALSKAHEYLKAYPGSRVLVVAVEICSGTFQPGDTSKTNLVASQLFGDGAAAVLVSDGDGHGPILLDHASHLIADTMTAMGFDLTDHGFTIVLDRHMPELIQTHVEALLTELLAPHGLRQDDLGSFVIHPGGRRILDVLQQVLALSDEALADSREILRTCGNMSSATVLFVLQRAMRERRVPAGTLGVLGAFGPGFSSELHVIRWD